MPVLTTVTTVELGPSTTVVPASDGATYIFGNLPDQFATGGFALSFVPSDTFVGSFVIVGRNAVKECVDDNVDMVPFPFRAFDLNGAIADVSVMQVSGTPITARSDILVPLAGMRGGVQVACTQGSCTIYSQAVVGSTAP